ncbi:hypothetical protein BGX21_001904 [Mortierella sp. AD011]|nr:hypothetical protein BGX20_001583 [Mortierella sp. AD010]KAF9403608.1 hypothetical protein BGX21_001904 [Mortierella sp. AD011]
MFVHWNLLILNLILAVFNALLIAALDSVLAIYSSIEVKYGSTIRWTRQSGYLEMFKILYHSRTKVPKAASRAMSLTLLASIVAVSIDKIATLSIHQSTVPSKHSKLEMVISPHIIFPTTSTTFQKWSTSVRYGGNSTDAVIRLINDTTNIPNFKRDSLYSPRTFDYDVGCDQIDLEFSYMDDTLPLVQTNESCATLFISLGANPLPLYQLANRTTLRKGRYSINLPAISDSSSSSIHEFIAETWYDYLQIRCRDISSSAGAVLYPRDGLTSIPQTSVIKCVYPDGVISVISSSSIRFMSTSSQQFRNVSAAIFDEHDELTQAIGVAMDRGAKDSTPSVLAEIKVVNNTVDILVCYSENSKEFSILVHMCEYRTTQLIVTTKQDINLSIDRARGGSPLSHVFVYSLMTRITHIPTVFNGTQIPIKPLSFLVLKNSTLELTHYMAALGQNAYVDWEQQRFFVMFDTKEILEGLEVPIWLMVLFSTIMAACLALWIYVKHNYRKYTYSLYHSIAQQVSGRISCDAPMLMSFEKDTKKLDGIPILSGEPRNKDDEPGEGDDEPRDEDDGLRLGNDASTSSTTLIELDHLNIEGIDSSVSLLNT